MKRLLRCQRGQAVVEFAIIGMVLMMLTVSLVDVGRAFFQYNAVAAGARYAARWGAVQGGTCALPYATSTSDFCNQLGNSSSSFWSQAGNKPLQGLNTSCPSYSSTPGDYYTASSYKSATATTIVGAVAQRFDSSDQGTSFIIGALTPGFDLTKLQVCIEVDSVNNTATPVTGDNVSVVLHYPFTPMGAILPNTTFSLDAQSQYEVE